MSREIYNSVMVCKITLGQMLSGFMSEEFASEKEVAQFVYKELAHILEKLQLEEQAMKDIINYLAELQLKRLNPDITRIRELVAVFDKTTSPAAVSFAKSVDKLCEEFGLAPSLDLTPAVKELKKKKK